MYRLICTFLFVYSIKPLFLMINVYMSCAVIKPTFCICENKDADQLRGNQRLCFRYIDSTTPLLSKSEISSLLAYFVAVQPGSCGTWSETQKTCFLTLRLYVPHQCFGVCQSITVTHKGAYMAILYQEIYYLGKKQTSISDCGMI